MPSRNYTVTLRAGEAASILGGVLYVFLDTNAAQAEDICSTGSGAALALQNLSPSGGGSSSISSSSSGSACVEKFKSDWAGQMSWLEDVLSHSTAEWKVVVGHHPVFNAAHHGDTALLVDTLRPILETHLVQLYLSGHEHDLQHLESSGVTYIISGGGSQVSTQTPLDKQHRFLKWGKLTHGFTANIIQSTDEMHVHFVDQTGEALHKAVIPKMQRAAVSGGGEIFRRKW